VPKIREKYAINHTPLQEHKNATFNLVIHKVALEDSGKYLCNQGQFYDQADDQCVVLYVSMRNYCHDKVAIFR
jgi:hypothetical protein